MPSKQGDLELLEHPIARELLGSTIPARLAYVWKDGTPRVVPIWFHWTGEEMVFVGPPGAPKVEVLETGTKVAVTVDDTTWPYKVLLLRGSVRSEVVDGVAPEYIAAAERYFGEEQGRAWVEQVRMLFSQTARITLRPAWVGIIDFESRFPYAIEKAMAGMAG
jgi:hypothetical protein